MKEIDPVCGMTVRERSWAAEHDSRRIFFCSSYCRDRFLSDPQRYDVGRTSGTLHLRRAQPRIAYFSMEVALPDDLPLYSGGLGVLAGDMLRSCADLGIPIVGVSLLYRQGYLEQQLDDSGWQSECGVRWEPARELEALAPVVQVEIDGRQVKVGAWRCTITGASHKHEVPVLLLDTDLEGNCQRDRMLTQRLYAGDAEHRLSQEIVLGIAGVRMLDALGYTRIDKYHMNEGHASLLVLELLRGSQGTSGEMPDFHAVRRQCVFTTHTPVAAGHDRFDYALASRLLPREISRGVLRMLAGPDRLNMTSLGMNISQFINGVARRHGEVARDMFPGMSIQYITNGVHHVNWTSASFRALFDELLPGWQEDASVLHHALDIPVQAIWQAHMQCKAALLDAVRQRAGMCLDPEALTIGFARRATSYKRSELVFSDAERLRRIAREQGPLQFIFAGKAHPNDEPGKQSIQRIVAAARQFAADIRVVYLQNYDVSLAKLLVAGSDLWLNTPRRPLEASGTSGMKAALNGVPSVSTLDGWWLEGHLEGVTGWSIGTREPGEDPDAANRADAEDLYRKLQRDILPLFHSNRDQWGALMRQCIALNGSHFNTHRMVHQYAAKAYLP